MDIARLPGTVIETDVTNLDRALQIFTPLFEAGGLVLSQVASLTGLPASQVQNWVRRGFISPPQCKRYTVQQFSRIAMICALKGSMQIEQIAALIRYLHFGISEGETVGDDVLYSCFVAVSARSVNNSGYDEKILERELQQLSERSWFVAVPRLQNVLRIMVVAYAASRVLQKIDLQLVDLIGA